MNEITVKSSLCAADIKDCIKEAQKEKGFTVKIIETVVLGLLICNYFPAFVNDTSYILGLVLSLVCVAIIAFIWILPEISMSKIGKSEADKEFTYIFSDEGIRTGDQMILYAEGMKAVNKSSRLLVLMFNRDKIIGFSKERMGEDFDKISELLKEKLGENYKLKK